MRKVHNIQAVQVRFWSAEITIALTVGLTGCADLGAVRDFAKQGSNLTEGGAAVKYWAEQPSRNGELVTLTSRIPGAEAPVAMPASDPQAAKDVLMVQGLLSAYLSALGSLADDGLPDVSSKVDQLVDAISKLPGQRSEQAREVNVAYGAILKLLHFPLDLYQNRKVQEMIRNNDGSIQKLVTALRLTAHAFDTELQSEKSNVDAWYSLNIDKVPGSRTVQTVLEQRDQKAAWLATYDTKRAALAQYDKALAAIGTQHAQLASEMSTFNSVSWRRAVAALHDARDEIVAARDQYRNAYGS